MPVLTLAPVDPVHPALYTALASPPPPPTPVSASTTFPARALPPPKVSYALLRAHHAAALRYQISKLRWEQACPENGYLRGEDAWLNHDRVVGILTDELQGVTNAQASLDQFPDVPAATWYPAPHGPPTRAELEAEEAAELDNQRALDARLNHYYPWLPQLYIGPMTRRAARNDRLLREQLAAGIMYDIEELLPKENFNLAMGLQKPGAKQPAPGAAAAASKERKMTYEEMKLDRERKKVAAMMKEAGIAVDSKGEGARNAKDKDGKGKPKDAEADGAHAGEAKGVTGKNADGGSHKAKDGGKDPKPKLAKTADATATAEADADAAADAAAADRLFAAQREQRRILMEWLRRPWGAYHAKAAGEIEGLARIAWRELEGAARAEAKAAKIERGDGARGGGEGAGAAGAGTKGDGAQGDEEAIKVEGEERAAGKKTEAVA